MGFTYRAITANCGNATLGAKASAQIAQQIEADKADFYAINCQEVNFNNALAELQKSVKAPYAVVRVADMITRTKISTFLGNTGLGTFIVYNTATVKIAGESAQEARRDKKAWGTANNKGGLITNLTLTKDGETIKVQTVSGHLDSTKIDKREQDWSTIHSAIVPPISNWDSLVKSMPNLRLTGYDANTRQKIEPEGIVNQWQTNSFELQGLKQAAIENQRYSAASTYKTHIETITVDEDENRPGYTRGGMLDIVGVADGGQSKELSTDVITYKQEAKTARDHDVIMCPKKEYIAPTSDFELVQGHVAALLINSAPTLANDIKNLIESEDNKQLLVTISQAFLGPEGLINKQLAIHQKQLAHQNRQGPDSKFPDTAWFASITLLTEPGVTPIAQHTNLMAQIIAVQNAQQSMINQVGVQYYRETMKRERSFDSLSSTSTFNLSEPNDSDVSDDSDDSSLSPMHSGKYP